MTFDQKETLYIRPAYLILYIGFIALPIIAGLDKFGEFLTDWSQYLAPVFPRLLSMTSETFMRVGGVIEVGVGLLVAWKPRYFAFVVAAWLVLIIINLFILGDYYDIALRDLGLSLAALALGFLALTPAARRVS